MGLSTNHFTCNTKCPGDRGNGLLEEPTYESIPIVSQFSTCSVTATYSYERTALIDPSKKLEFPLTTTGEGSPVVETEGPAEMSDPLEMDILLTTKPSPIVHPYRAIDTLNPLEEDAVYTWHIRPTPTHQKAILFLVPSHNDGCDTPLSSTRAHGRCMGVILDDPTHQNAPQAPDRPNDPDPGCLIQVCISTSTNSLRPRKDFFTA